MPTLLWIDCSSVQARAVSGGVWIDLDCDLS